MSPPDLPPCPVEGCVEPCQHLDQRQLVYIVPDALKTPAKPFRGAVRTKPAPAPPKPQTKR